MRSTRSRWEASIALFALGIAVIFGIMRLINFAHGELIMAGAYAVVLISLPAPVLIPVTLVIVVALALVMERVAFRPVRHAGAATLLITSFALSFSAPERRGAHLGVAAANDRLRVRPRPARSGSVRSRSRSSTWSSSRVTLVLLVAVSLFFRRTTLGTQMRAAAEDFRMARVLGIRANTVVAAGIRALGAARRGAAILLTAQTGTVSPTIGVSIVLFAFIATIVGGMGSLPGAVLGGFSIGALTVALQALAPARPQAIPRRVRLRRRARCSRRPAAGAHARTRRPSRERIPRRARLRDVLRQLADRRSRRRPPVDVAVQLHVAARPMHGARPRRSSPRASGRSLALMALACAVALVTFALGPSSLDRVVVGMVINLIVVVGLYTFVGISGVFSFGHAAFMAIGAYAGAILVIPPETKKFVLPELPDFLAERAPRPAPGDHRRGRAGRRVRARSLAFRSLVCPGLTAGLATFAVLSDRERRGAELAAGHARHVRRVRDPDDDDDLGSAWLGACRDGRRVGVSALADRPSPARLA